MRASLSGLTISHLCLSALPSERKKVPTTAQTPLRREKREKEKGVCTGGQRADVGLARNGSAGGAYLLVALLLCLEYTPVVEKDKRIPGAGVRTHGHLAHNPNP